MRATYLLLLFLPAIGFAEVVRLEAGATSAATSEALRKIGATDITPNLEIVGPRGEWPCYGLYWSVGDFKLVLEIGDRSLCYWTEDDFGVSKMHREDSRRRVRSILFDLAKKTYTLRKQPWWKFWK